MTPLQGSRVGASQCNPRPCLIRAGNVHDVLLFGAIIMRVGVLGVLPWRGWQAESLMVHLGAVLSFFSVVVSVEAIRYGFPMDLLRVVAWRPIWTGLWHSSSQSRLDCSVSGQPICPVRTQQKKRREACVSQPMEQTVPGSCALVATRELSRVGCLDGYFEQWLRSIRQRYAPKTYDVRIRKKLLMRRWDKTFQLDCSVLGQLPGRVTRSMQSWRGCLRPMKQKVPDTCTIVASTVAVVAIHLKAYGAETFDHAYKVAEGWTEQLRRACERDKIWKSGEGAKVRHVLRKIKELGGVRIQTRTKNSTEFSWPLCLCGWDWEEHGGELTPEHVAALLDQGPCIGRLWVCPWYGWFNAANSDDWVYRGCGRDKCAREECEVLYANQVMGSHAVVCFGYRFCQTENGVQQMHVLVLDNHDPDGPERWIDFEELDALFTLTITSKW